MRKRCGEEMCVKAAKIFDIRTLQNMSIVPTINHGNQIPLKREHTLLSLQ